MLAERIAVSTGGASLALGLAVLLGWLLRIPALVQPFDWSGAMVPGTALCFVLSGAGLMAAGRALRGVVAALAAALLLFGLLGLVRYFWGIEVGLDRLLTGSIAASPPIEGSMAPHTALGFTIVGAALLLASRERRAGRATLLGGLGSFLLGLPLVTVAGYASGMSPLFFSPDVSEMAFHTAGGFLLLAAGVLALAARDEARRGGAGPPWLPLAVGVAAAAAAVALRLSLEMVERQQVQRLADAQARSAANEFEAKAKARIDTLSRIARRFARYPPDRERWEYETSLNLQDFQGLSALLWVDADSKVRWVNPRGSFASLDGARLDERTPAGAALAAARKSGRPSGSSVAELPGIGQGLHIVVPALAGERVDWYVVGIFAVQTLYPSVLHAGVAAGWGIAVYDGEREIYRRSGSGPEPAEQWRGEATAHILNQERRIRVWPTPVLLERLRSPMPAVALGSGLAIALLLALATALAQSAWRRAAEAETARAAVAESEAQYRLLFDDSPQPMWVFDAETLAFLSVNQAAIRLYGWTREEFLSMSVREIRPPEEVEAVVAYVRQHASGEGTTLAAGRSWKHRTKDGRLLDVDVAHSSIRYAGRRAWLSLANDVTERKSLEAQFLQAQKMESVGRLAGGVAHDFNNLLGVILGYAQLLARRFAGEPQLHRYVQAILEASNRAAALTRQLLAFSRQQVAQPQVLDLNALVEKSEPMLQRLLGEDVEVRSLRGKDLGSVKADPTQIDQVLMNLAVNARDAMPKGGRLTIETANAELDDDYVRHHPEAATGRYVMLAVSDTGHGMTPDVQEHIFEPFFTTKVAGKGTGLGLGTVYGIVKQSGGHIWVYSERGQGTTFKIYLPRVEAAAAALGQAEAAGPLPRGSETILVVEDEEGLRGVVSELLESLGYAVLGARTGGEALALAQRVGQPLDLVITDVVLPGIGGRELGEQLVAIRPGVKVLYVSGYTDDAVVRYGVRAGEMEFLQKPFTSEALARKARAILDQ
jgi:PAS domain S-box-containing protein